MTIDVEDLIRRVRMDSPRAAIAARLEAARRREVAARVRRFLAGLHPDTVRDEPFVELLLEAADALDPE